MIPGKVMDTPFPILEAISKHIEDKKVIGSSQHGFVKEKSFLTNLIDCYNQRTGSVDERRAADIVCLGFSKAFFNVSPNILFFKPMKYRLFKWTENRFNC